MPRTCTICRHPRRRDIDKALLSGEAERSIAKHFEATTSAALHRHKPHVSAVLARTAEERRERSIADQMRELLDRCMNHLEIAEKGKKVSEMAMTSREVRETMKVLAQLTGELDERARVNVLIQQQQTRVGEQALMLDRLTIDERAELRRLVAKAQGEGDDAVEVLVQPAADGFAAQRDASV